MFVLLFLSWVSVPKLQGRMLLKAELGTSLPSLHQGSELTMTILLIFQMERSNFSALVLGTALPLLVFNPHHPSHTRGSKHPHKPVPQLRHCNSLSPWLGHICAL